MMIDKFYRNACKEMMNKIKIELKKSVWHFQKINVLLMNQFY